MDKMRRTFLGGVVLGVLLSLLGTLVFQTHRSEVGSRLLYSAPRLEQSALAAQGSLLVEVSVDTRGQVQDYRVLTHAGSKDLTPQMKNMLIFTTFHPATLMGKPVPGTAVLALSRAPGFESPTSVGNSN